MKNDNKPLFTFQDFPPYYGIFPYIIMRVAPSTYMQIPIHFIPDGERRDPEVFRGTHLFNVPHEYFELSLEERIRKEHEALVNLTWWCKKVVESENKFFKWWLVEAPNRSFFFEDDIITHSERIPNGGTLLTQTNEIIAILDTHYRKD